MGFSTRFYHRFISLTIALLLSVFSTPSQSFTLPQNSLDTLADKEGIETQQEIAVNVQDISQMEVLVDLPQLKPPKDIVRDSEKASQLTEIPEPKEVSEAVDGAHHDSKANTTGKEINQGKQRTDKPLEPVESGRITERTEKDKGTVQLDESSTVSNEFIENNVSLSVDKITPDKNVSASQEKSIPSKTVTDLKKSSTQPLELVNVTEVNITIGNDSEILSIKSDQKQVASEEVALETKEDSSAGEIIQVSERRVEKISVDISTEKLQRPSLIVSNSTYDGAPTSSADTGKTENANPPPPQGSNIKGTQGEKNRHEIKNPVLQEGESKTDEQNHSSKMDISKVQTSGEDDDDDEMEISKPAPEAQVSNTEGSRVEKTTHKRSPSVIEEEEPNVKEHKNGPNQTPKVDNSEYQTTKEDNDDEEEIETSSEERESSDQPLSLEERIASWLLGQKRKDQDQRSSSLLKNNKEVTDSHESTIDKVSKVDQDEDGDSLEKGSNVNEKKGSSETKGDKSTKKRFGSSISASAAMKNPEDNNVGGHVVSDDNKNTDSMTNEDKGDGTKRRQKEKDTKVLESDVEVTMKTVVDDEKPKTQGQAGHREKIPTNIETDQRELEPELSEPAWLSEVPLTTMRESSRGHIQDKSLRDSEEFLTSSGEGWTGRGKKRHGQKSSTAFKSQLNVEKNKRDYEDINDLNAMLRGNVIYNDDIGHNNDKENNYYKSDQAYYYNYDPEKMNLGPGLKPPYLEYSNRDFNDRANFYYEDKVKSGDEIPWDQEEKITSNVYHHEHAPTAFQTLENFVEEKPNFGKKTFSKTHAHRYDVHGPGKHVEISPFMARISISKKGADEALGTLDAGSEKEKQEDTEKKKINLDSDMVQKDTPETKQKVSTSVKEASEKKDKHPSSKDENLTPVPETKRKNEENKIGAPVIPVQEQNLSTPTTNSSIESQSLITVEVNGDKNKTVTVSISSIQTEPKTPGTTENKSEPRGDQMSKNDTKVSSMERSKSVNDQQSSSSNKGEQKSGAMPAEVKSSNIKTSTVANPSVVSKNGVISTQQVEKTTANSSRKVTNKDNLSKSSKKNPVGSLSEPDSVGHVNISNKNSKVSSNQNGNMPESLNKHEIRETHSNDLKSQSTSDSENEQLTTNSLQKTVGTSKEMNNTTDNTTSPPRNTVSVDIKINEAKNSSVDDKADSPLPKLESLLEAFKAPNAPASIDKRETKAVLKSDDKSVVLTLNEKGPAKKEEQELSKASHVTVSASVSQTVRGNASAPPSTTTVVISEKFHEVNNSDSLVPFLQKDAVVNDKNASTSNETLANNKDNDNETSIIPATSNSKTVSLHKITTNASSDSNKNSSVSSKGNENVKKRNPTSKSKVDLASGSQGTETSNSKTEPQISNFAPQNPFSRKLLSIPDLETDPNNNNTKPQTINTGSTSNATMRSGNDSAMSQSSKDRADNGHEFYDEVQNVTIQAATTAKTPVSTPHGNIRADKKSASGTKDTVKHSGDSKKKSTITTGSNSKSGITETKQKDVTLKDDSVSIDTFLSSQSNKTSSKATSDAEKKSGKKMDKSVSSNQDKSKGTKGNDTATEVMANESSFHTQGRNFSSKAVSPPSVVSQNITGQSDNKNLASKTEQEPATKLNTTSVSSLKSDGDEGTSVTSKNNTTKKENVTSRPNSKPLEQLVKQSNDKKTASAPTGGNTTKLKDLVKTNPGTPKKSEEIKNVTSGDAKPSTEKVLKTVGGLPYYSSAAAAAHEVPPISAYRLQDFSLSKPVKNDKKDEKKDKANDKKDKKDDPKTKSASVNGTKGEKDKNGDDGCSTSCNQDSGLPPARPQAAVSAVLTTHFGPTKDEMVPFDLELLDLADNYDNTTGMFICTIPGTYVISLYLMSHPGAKVNARVFINNRPIAALWADDAKNAGFYPSSSTQTIAQLGFGDQVYVMLVDGGYGESWVHANYNVFTVFLLYEQLF